MTGRWVLAVDLGTGGPKTAAVTLDGELLATAFTEVPTVHSGDGGATQDVHHWWRGIQDAVRGFVADGVVSGDDLHAVGLAGQYASSVPVDATGRPVEGCIMWSDRRGSEYTRQAIGGPVAGYDPRVLATGVRYAGGVPLPTGEDPLGHELFLRNDRPAQWRRTRVLLEAVDYLGLRFTGQPAATPASMFISWLTDNRPGRTPRYRPELVRRFNRDPRRLPRLRPTGSVLGPMLPEVAAELGVRAGAPVVCGVTDKHAAFLGSGAVGPYQGHVAISTTGWISAPVPFKKLDPFRLIATIPGVDGSSNLVVNDQASAGACLQWWREQVMSGGEDEAPSYEQLISAAESVLPGSGGTLFLPWLHGEFSPLDDRTVRGGFVNLGLTTDRASMTRAVLEGVALNARWLLGAVERFNDRPFPSLRILGGGAQSDLWCQIMADVLGLPLEQVADPRNAQLRGAALFALVSLGERSLEEAAATVPVARTFRPERVAARTYDEVFVEFQAFYKAMRPTYRKLRRR